MMKQLITTVILGLISIVVTAQNSYEQWEIESMTNKRLLPRYGNIPKSAGEINSDSAFIRDIMSQPQFKTRRDASKHLIDLGFRYYYRPDLKTAMYRFNQAFLLDSTNTDIYWGYGAIYMAFGRFDLAKEQYDLGLSINPENTHLLTDVATYFMQEYYLAKQMPKNDVVKNPQQLASQFMDSAIFNLNKSFRLNPTDVNTVYKLSICYWNIDDCKNAWKFYDLCVELGGAPITPGYTNDLKKRCKK